MFIDAIIAANSPNRVTTTGQVAAGANPGIFGRTYKAIVQDMIDYYSYCQYDSVASGNLAAGGWRYTCNVFPDNSVDQWAAIGFIPAERDGYLSGSIPAPVKLATKDWLTFTQNSTGSFGYSSTAEAGWGFYALTPSGMVQMAWLGIGRGPTVPTMWDKAETFYRDRFHLTGGATVAPKSYYYGLFSFVKSMLLHDSNGDGIQEPVHAPVIYCGCQSD